MKANRLVPALLAAALAFAAGCGSGDDDDGGNATSGQGQKVDTVKIAAPFELTGPVAAFGVPFSKAMQQAVDHINNSGGIKSLGGAKLELMLKDSESDPQLATQLLREMDREDPVVAVGPFGSANAVAVKPVLVSLGLPYITPALEESLTDGDHGRNIWRVVSRTSDWGAVTMDFIEQQMKAGKIDVKKMAFPYISTPPGPSLMEAVKKRAEAMGIEFRAFEYNPAETRDFSSIVARIRDFDPDIVSGLNYPADGTLFAEAMTLQNWRPKHGFVMIAGAYYLNSFRKSLGDRTVGWMAASYGSAVGTDCDIANTLNETYQRASGGEPLTGLDTAAASEIAVIVDALERAGSTDREAFRKALAETNLKFCDSTYLLAGEVQFDEKGDNVGFSPTIVQHEGELDQIGVYPENVASRDAQWPAHDKAQGTE